jgi:hypothetical protein
MVLWKLPAEWRPWIAALSACLHGRLAKRLEPLLIGLLFGRGRRTVASWLRAAGIGRLFARTCFRHRFALNHFRCLSGIGIEPLSSLARGAVKAIWRKEESFVGYECAAASGSFTPVSS